MPTTVIEVVDSAIKIGLGGLIGFIGTYAVTKLNHNHDSNKERSKRHFDTLEQVVSHIEDFSHVALKYWALVADSVRVENDGKLWPKEKFDQLNLVKAEYFTEAKNVTVAESKLLLLGLTNATEKLKLYTDFLKVLRREYYVGRSELTEKEIDEVRLELLSLRQDFFSEVSKSYRNGL